MSETDDPTFDEESTPIHFIYAEETNLSPSALKALNLGAILGLQNESPINLVATGLNVWEAKQALDKWWGISDLESFRTTLAWLEKEGHRIYFSAARAIANLPRERVPEGVQAALRGKSATPELEEEITGFSNHIRDFLSVASPEAIELMMSTQDVTAWDIGRAINMIRWGCDANFFAEQVAVQMIERLGEKVYPRYGSWAEFGNAYLMGQVMWGGVSERINTSIDVLAVLNAAEGSPWVTIPWQN
ncbi:MAG: DUF1266 domain-containing protein [Proteobacteria bacterium]|nr:MAG: DUF1266 domain-containing protein [Pseudomonadota bacterium]